MTDFLINLYFGINFCLAGYAYGVNEDDIEDSSDWFHFLVFFAALAICGSVFLTACILIETYVLLKDKSHTALLNSESWWIPVRTIYFVYFTKEWDHHPFFMPDIINPKIEAARQGGWRKKLLYNALVTIRNRVAQNSLKWPQFSRDYFSIKENNESPGL